MDGRFFFFRLIIISSVGFGVAFHRDPNLVGDSVSHLHRYFRVVKSFSRSTFSTDAAGANGGTREGASGWDAEAASSWGSWDAVGPVFPLEVDVTMRRLGNEESSNRDRNARAGD